MSSYAVSGASGRLGRLAVGELLTRGLPASNIVALVRTPSKAADLAERGVQVREADYSRPDTLNAALAGVDRLLLVSSSEPGQRVAHHTNVVEAAKTAGVLRIVYTSTLLHGLRARSRRSPRTERRARQQRCEPGGSKASGHERRPRWQGQLPPSIPARRPEAEPDTMATVSRMAVDSNMVPFLSCGGTSAVTSTQRASPRSLRVPAWPSGRLSDRHQTQR